MKLMDSTNIDGKERKYKGIPLYPGGSLLYASDLHRVEWS